MKLTDLYLHKNGFLTEYPDDYEESECKEASLLDVNSEMITNYLSDCAENENRHSIVGSYELILEIMNQTGIHAAHILTFFIKLLEQDGLIQ